MSDIYIMTRASKSDLFGSMQAQTALNTNAYEAPNYITADGCELYFERNGALFVAKRGM